MINAPPAPSVETLGYFRRVPLGRPDNREDWDARNRGASPAAQCGGELLVASRWDAPRR